MLGIVIIYPGNQFKVVIRRTNSKVRHVSSKTKAITS